MNTQTIAIIGTGNMGAALIHGLIANGHPPEKIWAADTSKEKLSSLQKQFNIHITTKNEDAVNHADAVLFAVKPQTFSSIAKSLAASIQTARILVISIAAGVRENSIQKWLGGNIPIVRCMPNTPALIGCGASALYANKFVTEKQHNLAESILRACGIVIWVEDEKQMDVVTALSGSGPAYFFLVMEALYNAAVQQGLSEEHAKLLTMQTALGAARMALESDHSLATLRQQVTSPGGTTEKALEIFEAKELREIFSQALGAAKKRSEELAEMLEKE